MTDPSLHQFQKENAKKYLFCVFFWSLPTNGDYMNVNVLFSQTHIKCVSMRRSKKLLEFLGFYTKIRSPYMNNKEVTIKGTQFYSSKRLHELNRYRNNFCYSPYVK